MKLVQHLLTQKLFFTKPQLQHIAKGTKGFLTCLLALVVVSGYLLSACASDQSLTKKTRVRAANTQTQKIAAPGLTSTFAYSNDPEIKAVQMAYYSGNFNEVLSLTRNAEKSMLKYYRGMTFFAMMTYKHRFPAEKLKKYRDETAALLSQVIDEADDEELKHKARIWLGVSYDINFAQRSLKLKALKLLRTVQNDKAYREKFYNEVMLYKGDIYARIGNYIRARDHYKQVANSPYPKDPVYDHVGKRFTSAEQASKNAYARLKLYVDGTHPDYKPVVN